MHALAQTLFGGFAQIITLLDAEDVDAERRGQRRNRAVGAGEQGRDQRDDKNDLHHGRQMPEHNRRKNLIAPFVYADHRRKQVQQPAQKQEQQHHRQHDDA